MPESMLNIYREKPNLFLRTTSKSGIAKNLHPVVKSGFPTIIQTTDHFPHFYQTTSDQVGLNLTLHLGPGCCSNRVIVHELLHNLGAHHEQTRPDRY